MAAERPGKRPPPIALTVKIILHQNPSIEFFFHNSRYIKEHGRQVALTINANDQLDSILLDESSYFGIRFSTAEIASKWHRHVPSPWQTLFSRDSGSQTVWIRRAFRADQLARKIPLEVTSYAPNRRRDDRLNKSRNMADEKITNQFSKWARKRMR